MSIKRNTNGTKPTEIVCGRIAGTQQGYIFCKQSKKDGFEQIAAVFEETAS